MLLYQYLLTGWCICWISTTTTTPKLTYEHMHDGSRSWSYFHHSPIILTHGPLTDHLITRTMLSLYHTTLAIVAQRTHQDVRHIARSITYDWTTVAYSLRFRICLLSYEHLFHANIHKTDCEFLCSHDICATIVQQLWQAPSVVRSGQGRTLVLYLKHQRSLLSCLYSLLVQSVKP